MKLHIKVILENIKDQFMKVLSIHAQYVIFMQDQKVTLETTRNLFMVVSSIPAQFVAFKLKDRILFGDIRNLKTIHESVNICNYHATKV